jgi:hypothetical protein
MRACVTRVTVAPVRNSRRFVVAATLCANQQCYSTHHTDVTSRVSSAEVQNSRSEPCGAGGLPPLDGVRLRSSMRAMGNKSHDAGLLPMPVVPRNVDTTSTMSNASCLVHR